MVVLHCGCGFPLGVQALVPPERCRQRSATTCVLTGATWHKLQNDLQLTATCARFGGVQISPRCEPRLADVSAGPGAT